MGKEQSAWGEPAGLNENERVARLRFAGDLDVYRRGEFEAAFPPPDSIDRIVIDMRETSILDSSIITLLMRYRRAFTEAGGDPLNMVLVVPPSLRRIFEITGLMNLMTILTATPEQESDPLTGV